MPLTVLDAAQAEAAMIAGSSNLRYVLDDVGVRLPIQAVLFHHGFGTIARFVGMEDTKASMRDAIRAVMGIRATDGVEQRCDIADLLTAWENARARLASEIQMRAERSVQELVQPASNLDMKAMLKAHEKLHGDLESRLVPGRYLLGTKLEEVQSNEPEPERLKDITTKDDGDEETLTTEVGRDGRLTVKKGCKKEVKDPATPEELRTRYRVLAHAWEFANLKHPGRVWLQNYGTSTYNKLADYILGPKVAGLRILRVPGNPDSGVKPAWTTILAYEYEIRKHAFELVRRGKHTGVAAMMEAMDNAEIRGLHFTAVFQVQSTSAKNGADDHAKVDKKREKSDDGPDKEGRSKKKKQRNRGNDSKGNKKKQHTHSAEGRAICFKFGKKGASQCDGTCGMLHICQYCFGDHKYSACTA